MDFKSQNKNIKANVEEESEVIELKNGQLKKKTRYMQFGKDDNYSTKLQKIKAELISVYGSLPVGLGFYKMETKKQEFNIDGYRVCARCEWLERDRIFDKGGIFKIGSLIRTINKELLGKTKAGVSANKKIDSTIEDWLNE